MLSISVLYSGGHRLQSGTWKCVIPVVCVCVCVCEHWKGYVVKHNYVN